MAATAGASLSPYVLLEIFEHLSPRRKHLPEGLYIAGPLAEDERHIRRQCLARLALVSRFVSALALDVLWAHVDDFRDLLSVFPSYDRQFTVQRFRDIVTDADWTRFQTYAGRVRSLHIRNTENIHANVWTTLTRLSPRDTLLPRLEQLTGFVVNELSTCYTLLFSPTIRTLALKVERHIDIGTLRMVMQACQCTLSSLRHLTVDEVIDVPDGAGRCRPPAIQAWPLAQLQSLRVVQEISLTADDLHALAALPDLRCLVLMLKGVPKMNTPLSVASFPKLRELALVGLVGHVAEFITMACPPMLETLVAMGELSCHDPAFVRRTRDSIGALSASLPSTLRSFRLDLICQCRSASQFHFADAGELLEPLQRLSGLREIQLTLRAMFHLPDKVLRSLTNAWPNLFVFRLSTLTRAGSMSSMNYTDYYNSFESTLSTTIPAAVDPEVSWSSGKPARPDGPPTLSTIAAFAYTHPHLERLEVPALDLRTLPEPDAVPLLGHKLREFRVSELPAGMPLLGSAMVLDVLFPHLDLSDAPGIVARGDRNRMSELSLILLALQAGRVGAHRMRAAMLGPCNGDIPIPACSRGQSGGRK